MRKRRPALLIPLLLLWVSACGVAGGLSDNPPVGSHSSRNYLGVAAGQPATSQAASTPSPKVNTGGQQQWKLVWQDNFTGSSVTDNWDYITGGSGFGDQSLQWFGDTNATTGPGGLTITAVKGGSGQTCWYGSCEYTSAEIKTSFAQKYGRFEARIKLPGGSGLWPAFWMLPAGGTQGQRTPGEIDVVEVNNRNPNEITGYVHDAEFFNYKALKVLSARPSSGFHTYGVDWTPGGITWTFDGVSYGHVSKYSGWPFNQPFYMLLDLAVGGSWPGAPTASTVFPAEFQVSWIRVYQMAGLPRTLRAKEWW